MAFVQARQGYFSGTSSTLAFLSNVAANSLLVISLHAYSNVTDAVTVTDSQGNTYTRRILTNNGSLGLQIWWAIAGSAGADTITVTFPGTTYCSIGIHEYSNMATATPVDVSNSATGSSTTPSSGAITTTNANDLLFAAYTDANGTNFTIDGDGDYVQRLEYQDGVNFMHQHTQDRTVTNTLTDTANWTIGASASWVGGIVAFKAAAGIPPTTVSVNAAAVSATPQAAAVAVGAVSVGLGAANLVASPQALVVQPGAVSVALETAQVNPAGQALGVLPGAASVPLGSASLAAAGQAVTAVPGAASVGLNAAAVAAQGQAIAVVNAGMLYLTANQVGLSVHLEWV